MAIAGRNCKTSAAVMRWCLVGSSPSRLTLNYDPSSGVFRLANTTQVATLVFQASSLARGRFRAGDGGAGTTVITREPP